MPKYKESICIICGQKVFREPDSQGLFCGKFDCLNKFADEIECPKCGTPIAEFSKNGIGMGMVTQWMLACPKHQEVRFKRFSFCPDVEICPKCKGEVIGEIDLEFLKDTGYCLRCDSILGDMLAESKEIMDKEGSEEVEDGGV